jgi:tetratricopeptide (TPR) repeat protein
MSHSLPSFPRAIPLLLALAACGVTPTAVDGEPTAAQLGGAHLPVTCASDRAQRWFDRGLGWCYAFHHDEATRCFRRALEHDPDCAMAWWGIAYAAGPNINNMEMDDAAAERAHEAAERAAAGSARCTPMERALIAAVGRRYRWPAPDDRAQLDRDYADAMATVYERHGRNGDVAVLYAESLMNLRPWDLWTADGEPQPGTDVVLSVLERTLREHPDHPQANHLYIHAVEASPQPECALPCAERLIDLAPAAGHLTHMPSHVFVRVGRYEDAAAANRRAIAADQRILARTGRVGFYELYRAHNYHFLVYAAMFAGRADEAIAAADEMVHELPADVVRELPEFLEGFLAVPFHALVRFGRWQEILARPAPPEWQLSTRAVRHYARGIALAALGRVVEARDEQRAFTELAAQVPESWTIGNNPTRTVLAIGAAFLDGEIRFRDGDREAAFASLRLAVERADALRYDEPWGWMMPPRHALGALLLEHGRVAEARAVYEQDLRHNPDNGWALRGLVECAERAGGDTRAAALRTRFAAAWANASVEIGASCYCRQQP